MNLEKWVKFLFLDIDGVLNDKSWAHWMTFNPPKVDRLAHINPFLVANLCFVLHECPDVFIVISSSWRHRYTVDELREILSRFGLPPARILGMTSRKDDNPRGERILEWLVDNKVQDNFFLIVDDDEDMSYLWPHHFHTDGDLGLTAKMADEMIEAYKAKELPFMPSAADRKFFWETRRMLYDKMGIDEAAAWLSRRNTEFANKSPTNWVKGCIGLASEKAWSEVGPDKDSNWVKAQVEEVAEKAWRGVQDVVRKIP